MSRTPNHHIQNPNKTDNNSQSSFLPQPIPCITQPAAEALLPKQNENIMSSEPLSERDYNELLCSLLPGEALPLLGQDDGSASESFFESFCVII